MSGKLAWKNKAGSNCDQMAERTKKPRLLVRPGLFQLEKDSDYSTDTLVVSFTPSVVCQVTKYMPLANGRVG
jgi:hypothetical protein